MRVLKTREQFFAAIERHQRELLPEQAAPVSKAFSGEAMDFRPGPVETIAQARNAIEALLEPMRSVRELGKRIHDSYEQLTSRMLADHRAAIEGGDVELMIVISRLCARKEISRPQWLDRALAKWAVEQLT